ncbi:ParB family protein [Chitinimonas lacunae]|uniref:ParB family protein n=1 Tax=Chitinimonas lacunae TaxID=1963018 RepID=A0ABV8MSY5_9NEIS
MTDRAIDELASKLLADNFARLGPAAGTVSDPIADTPMVVTLDELRPYEWNPRLTRNPSYDDIKASIRERGLEAPPAITRRPGESHYVIRNGGNTRLAILRELWAETRDERYFRIPCLFRPWPERGEIIALTGHLCENDVRGSLTLIERALGVEKARELYEAECGRALSQSELARRLAADGYPVSQPHISRMQEAVRFLLPAIPTVLYAGLGRPQVEKLTAMRRAAQRIWERRADAATLTVGFPTLFQDVLAAFDLDPQGFSIQRVQDELVGAMAELLQADYDLLTLELDETETRQRALSTDPVPVASPSAPTGEATPDAGPALPPTERRRTSDTEAPAQVVPLPKAARPDAPREPPAEVPTTRLQSIQQLVAEHTGETFGQIEADGAATDALAVDARFPTTDLWSVEPDLHAPAPLRAQLAQLARAIANEAAVADCVQPMPQGLGFDCSADAGDDRSGQALLALLSSLAAGYRGDHATTVSTPALAQGLALLVRAGPGSRPVPRLSDLGLFKLFRLIRLARVLVDIEPHAASFFGGTHVDASSTQPGRGGAGPA